LTQSKHERDKKDPVGEPTITATGC
jgi:hypothetical protein